MNNKLLVLLAVCFMALSVHAFSGHLPDNGAITGYDLHVYFFNNTESRSYAELLFAQAKAQFPNLVTKIFYAPVGPHILVPFLFSNFCAAHV
jgi:hypothetical protein